MCTRTECIEKLTNAAPYIREEFGVRSMCLFGSMARGDNNPDSDIDLFVDMPPKALKVLKLKTFLQDLLGVSVDLIRKHNGLRPLLLSQIEKDAIYLIQ
jgi:hypothetical protein